jgi:hypothetical protein
MEAYCSMNWSTTKATVIYDGRNLDEPVDMNSRGVEYLGIVRVVFDLNQGELSQ